MTTTFLPLNHQRACKDFNINLVGLKKYFAIVARQKVINVTALQTDLEQYKHCISLIIWSLQQNNLQIFNIR